MDVPKGLAAALAINRAAFGLNYLLRPRQARASWIGRAAKKPGTQVMVRSQGVRDVALGAGALRALARGDARELRAWVTGHAVCDLADLVATLAARDDLPRRRARTAMAVAAASTLVGGVAAAGLRPPRATQAETPTMIALHPDDLDFADAYLEGDDTARWTSASGHSPSIGARASGSSVIAVPVGCVLPRHTDSAEETIVVLEGSADVGVGDERATLPAGGLAIVPEGVPHDVRNAGDAVLRFAAVYAAGDVVTRYEERVQPDGSHQRHTVS
jgi:quercetin dioxygenase-like cupin family protein